MTEAQKKHFRAVRFLTAATLLWSLSFPLIKAIGMVQGQIVPEASSWFHASLTGVVRFTVAAVILGLFSWRTLRSTTRAEISEGLGLAFFGGVGILLQMDGLNHTPASTSAFLTQAYCVIVPLAVACRDRVAPARRVLIAILLMLLGVGVLSNFNPRTFHLGRGEAETLLSAVFFAGQILWLERPAYAKNDPNRFSLIMFLGTALVCLPVLVATSPDAGAPWRCYSVPSVWIMSGAITVFCTVGAYLIMNKWQPVIPSTEAAIIYGLEPVGAAAMALFLPALISRTAGIPYPNESITLQLLAGGTLILAANLVLQWRWAAAPTSGR